MPVDNYPHIDRETPLIHALHTLARRIEEQDKKLDLILAKVDATEATQEVISQRARKILALQEKTLSQIDDLTNAVADVQTSVANVANDITAIAGTVATTATDVAAAIVLLQGIGSDNPAVAQAISNLQGVKSTLDNAGTQLETAGTTLSDTDTALEGALGGTGAPKAAATAPPSDDSHLSPESTDRHPR